ncbi:hypothetical protein ACIQ1D_23195 [Lysinibacillus xylanilyticus]|uniref:hypothetical protein n=1 Tax=Lysinibacillus xylanilyticus TaxID=582475 RepID=UPI003809FCDD
MTKEIQGTVYQLPKPDAGWRPLDIQMFPGEGDETPVDQTPPADPQPIDNGGAKEPTPPEKTFTQEDVNNLIKRESSKQQEKMLKELGIIDFYQYLVRPITELPNLPIHHQPRFHIIISWKIPKLHM